jgi:hypothetical protein
MKFTPINSKIDGNPFTPGSCRLALKGRRNRPEQGEQGTTLVEVAVAGAILAVGLAGLYALLGTSVNQVKRGHPASAQENTVARLDQMRNLGPALQTQPRWPRCSAPQTHRIVHRPFLGK